MSTERIQLSRADGVLEIVLNRPEARNALENSMIAAIVDAIEHDALQPDVRAVLLRGEGKAFCAGDDLKDMGTAEHPLQPNPFDEYAAGYPRIVASLQRLEKPVVCAVHGYAMGAGLEMALASDLIIAARDATIAVPFVRRGIAAGTVLLARATNYHYAANLLYTGRIAPITELAGFGVVAQLCEADEVLSTARAVAAELAHGATSVIGAMKRAMHEGLATTTEAAFALQVAATVNSSLSDDFVEGKEAFAQKRDPIFRGK